MTRVVPATPAGQAHWTQRTALDGRDYLLTFGWNQRTGHWYLAVADADAVPIVTGRALVVGTGLLRGVTDARRPPGELVVLDAEGTGEDPGFADLGGRFTLYYLDAADLA